MSKKNVIKINELIDTVNPTHAIHSASTANLVGDDKRDGAGGRPFQTKWNEEAHMALLLVLMDVVTENGSIPISKHKGQIIAGMEAHGFGFTWEAVR